MDGQHSKEQEAKAEQYLLKVKAKKQRKRLSSKNSFSFTPQHKDKWFSSMKPFKHSLSLSNRSGPDAPESRQSVEDITFPEFFPLHLKRGPANSNTSNSLRKSTSPLKY